MEESASKNDHIQEELLHNFSLNFLDDKRLSQTTTPGDGFTVNDLDIPPPKISRPRTFPYFKLLPYNVEDETERNSALEEILRQLYIAVKAKDIVPGALYWTKELRSWMVLKFELTCELRAKLVKLYYMLSLAPGIDRTAIDRFESMFRYLLKRKRYLKPGKDLVLDWRPLWRELKSLVLPHEGAQHQSVAGRRRGHKNITVMCNSASTYFDPRERKAILEEILPYFATSDITGAFVVMGCLNLLLPTGAAPEEPGNLEPQDFLPTLFHLWSLVNRSKTVDIIFFDIMSRLARDHLSCEYVQFSEHGIFTKDQSDYILTALLRLTEIPVGQASSPYCGLIDLGAGLALFLEKDRKRNPVAYSIARWIVMSLSPSCLDKPGSILSNLQGLMESTETFFHPSNHGSWTDILSQITYHLVDFFVMRWNREKSGELETPPERRINDELKKRFVLSLKEVIFVGLFSKKPKSLNYFFGAFQGLAYLEPHLVLPGALQRFYPSLQGLVEVHRTQSSLCGLQMVANILSQNKGLRCHITALLALALPGIDANDLQKTLHTLNFITAVAYSVPFYNLNEGNSECSASSLAIQWVQGEMERMENDGPNVEIDYRTELSDEYEAKILRSSTASFGEFVLSLLEKIFTLLENLPELSRARSGSPEENVINTLPATLTPLFAALSPEIYDKALNKVASFVGGHVVNQARDAMAFLCNSLCKANPDKTLKIFVPMLIVGIRNEIDCNDAASDRSSGTDVLPRDRALVWHISMLSMIVVHVGDSLMAYKKDLFEIAIYMQEKCKGIPTIHISNYIHHLLLNLTLIYPTDGAMYETGVYEKGIDITDWAKTTDPHDLNIRWHIPSNKEIEFALELFESQVKTAFDRLTNLISDEISVSRKGKNKEWSDDVSRNISQLRLMLSGIATLFDPKNASENIDIGLVDLGKYQNIPSKGVDNSLVETVDDEETRPQFHYQAGYLLEKGGRIYNNIHKLRQDIGQLLSRIHTFLLTEQEDDVACFTALYQAYRTWITDVGNERSAHMLERMIKLYNSDARPFKISGLRKVYPRSLLIKRAGVYHLQRAKHNTSARHKSNLDERLLFDLASSSVSLYAEVRINAQSALESALKCLIDGRTVVIPLLLDAFRQALNDHQYDVIKGCLYTIFYLSLTKTISKDWRYAPSVIELYIKTLSVDKPSIQRISSNALYGGLSEFGKLLDHYVALDEGVIDAFKPKEDISAEIKLKHDLILQRRINIEDAKSALALRLIDISRNSHWKVALRCSIFILNTGLRVQSLASSALIKLFVNGCIDDHPGLRVCYSESLLRIFNYIEIRGIYDHSFEKYIREEENQLNFLDISVQKDNPKWTQEYLDGFGKPGVPEYYIDRDFPGWLMWGKSFRASRASPLPKTDWDELEQNARTQIGSLITREWYNKFFGYMKQEPRDSASDRFRAHNAALLVQTFDLTVNDLTAATFQDVKELLKEIYGDGTDKHQHRAAAEIIGALLTCVIGNTLEKRNKVWSYTVPILLQVFSDGLTPENISYWMSCVHMVIGGRDPRRAREIYDELVSFRLGVSSDTAFKESAKLLILELAIQDAGWHFRSEKQILEKFLTHIDHPYKAVREAIGRTIASIYRTRYYEGYMNVDDLLNANKSSSSLGIKPYVPTEEFTSTIKDVFRRIEKWRLEREPGQQTPSSYTSGSKTVLVWLDTTLQSYECTQLQNFFPDVFMEPLLHMMDVKEDPELQRLAYLVYRHLPNIAFHKGEDVEFISALIRIGKLSTSWHQRLRTLINMQVIYFRRIFLIQPDQKHALFNAVSDMLEDPQHEVRQGASSTLSGMIRCSPIALRSSFLPALRVRFIDALKKNPMPPRTPGTSTPVNNNQQIIRRHAAVLGLGALITAFPYVTPPPEWLPETLAILASRAANDPGSIGKTVKQILADFKKTRQDTWATDQKYFTPEQLEDLEGVLWKSYFA
ncbi:Proteasome activator complex subunit 4 [Golovinomyces cichoracearum]|uniref:Proteasome activator complex subunit 4 n=1 Tax=Golovinomyces cichoracearum TaxID=62708 RepID=A0A420H1X8_9PEZI|nr:Proteasome activator complex subunit 4 [Golovinomyces cichoracearum]